MNACDFRELWQYWSQFPQKDSSQPSPGILSIAVILWIKPPNFQTTPLELSVSFSEKPLKNWRESKTLYW